MEEQPRDEQPKPDDEAEQAHHIDDGQSADAFLHELAEVRHHADGEEGEQEEDDAERVQRTGNARAGLLQLGGLEADDEENGKRDDIAEHEAGETGPHVAPVHGPVAGLVKLGAPYPCEDQGPHADEYVDEDFDGGGDHDDPAGFPVDPGFGGLGEDQRFGDGAGSDGSAVGLDGEAHPAACDHGFSGQEVLRDEGEDQHFDAGEYHDERGNHDRNDGPGADGRARGDGGGNAADGDAGRQRGRPFAVELEVPAGDVIDHAPVEEIGFNNGAQSPENDVPGETGGVGGLHAEFRAHDDDGDLDEQLGTAGVLQRFRKIRHKVTDHDAHDESEDEPRLGAQAQRPRNPLRLELGGVGRDVGVGAQRITNHGDKEDDGEGLDELHHVVPHELHTTSQRARQDGIGSEQCAIAGEKTFGGGTPRVKRIAHPHADFDGPAEHVYPAELEQGKDKDDASKQQGYAIFIQRLSYGFHIPHSEICS